MDPKKFFNELKRQLFADEHSALARVTIYWHRERSGEHAPWNRHDCAQGRNQLEVWRYIWDEMVGMRPESFRLV